MTTPDPFEHLDGAYVFGALEPAEAAQFEAHLATCAECAARVAAAREVTALFADISIDEIESAPVPVTLLPGLLRKAAAARRRQRWLVGGLTGVAAACLLTVAIVLWPTSSGTDGRTIAMTPLGQTAVTARVQLVQTSSGTAIKLHCEYAAGGGGAAQYGLVVRDKHGQAHTLSTWTIRPGQDEWYPATTALPESQISRIDVVYGDVSILTANI